MTKQRNYDYTELATDIAQDFFPDDLENARVFFNQLKRDLEYAREHGYQMARPGGDRERIEPRYISIRLAASGSGQRGAPARIARILDNLDIAILNGKAAAIAEQDAEKERNTPKLSYMTTERATELLDYDEVSFEQIQEHDIRTHSDWKRIGEHFYNDTLKLAAPVGSAAFSVLLTYRTFASGTMTGRLSSADRNESNAPKNISQVEEDHPTPQQTKDYPAISMLDGLEFFHDVTWELRDGIWYNHRDRVCVEIGEAHEYLTRRKGVCIGGQLATTAHKLKVSPEPKRKPTVKKLRKTTLADWLDSEGWVHDAEHRQFTHPELEVAISHTAPEYAILKERHGPRDEQPRLPQLDGGFEEVTGVIIALDHDHWSLWYGNFTNNTLRMIARPGTKAFEYLMKKRMGSKPEEGVGDQGEIVFQEPREFLARDHDLVYGNAAVHCVSCGLRITHNDRRFNAAFQEATAQADEAREHARKYRAEVESQGN